MTNRLTAGRAALLLGTIAVLLLSACSADDDGATTATSERVTDTESTVEGFTMPGPPSEEAVATPVIAGPITGGAGSVVLGPPKFDLSTVGYVEEEFFISGEATSFTSDEALAEDGEWTVSPDETAEYTTRVVVRRPVDADRFDGSVIVEWFNVSGGLDADPDWNYTHVELIRSGSVWVGVSAQQAGVVGGGNALGAALALKNADPERYAELDHPGDDYSYDIFSQAGAAVWRGSDMLLGGLEPELVMAMGESQSAFRLTTYVNAVAPSTRVYGGYFVHSRAGSAAPLRGDEFPAPTPTLVRTDLDVPVLVFTAETDLTEDGQGYIAARQPDTDRIAGWEIAGTAHADAYSLGIGDNDDGSGAGDAALFAAMSEPPSSVYFGVIECDAPINTGPHTYVARAAVSALREWARTGEAPPEMPRLEVDEQGALVRAEDGNALGGIRTPQVDVPIAVLSGFGQSGESFCRLFGTTVPFDPAQLSSAHTDREQFVEQWLVSLEESVESGAILPEDASNLRTVVEESPILR